MLPSLKVSAQGAFRTNFAVLHLLSAAQFTCAVRQLEVRHKGAEFGAFWEEILANATASVMLNVAALESYANELFADANRNFPDTPPDVLDKLWDLLEQRPLLEKYETAVVLRGHSRLNRGARPFQDIHALVRLRNAITHFKPEWSNERKNHDSLSMVLAPFMNRSPFFAETEPLFPRGWASASCVGWAQEATLDFISSFEKHAAIPSRINKFVDRIHAISTPAL